VETVDKSEMVDDSIIEWERSQNTDERGDPIWGLDVYRLSRFALDLAREDCRRHEKILPRESRDQLLGAAGSIAANIAEGYSRPTAADRARFYAYALGSLREAVVWYTSLRDHLDPPLVTDRIALLSRVRRLLFGLLKAAKRVNSSGTLKR
jgi:four helix bundle protein